jgi:hypothetical protein
MGLASKQQIHSFIHVTPVAEAHTTNAAYNTLFIDRTFVQNQLDPCCPYNTANASHDAVRVL